MCEPVRGRVLEPCRGHQVSVKFDASLQFVHLGQEQPRNKAVFLGVGGVSFRKLPTLICSHSWRLVKVVVARFLYLKLDTSVSYMKYCVEYMERWKVSKYSDSLN